MSWFNYYGLAVIAIIMIPNIIFAIKHKDGFTSKYKNKFFEIAEQIGRYACFALMIFNIPYTYTNFWFESALTVYLSVNGILCAAYLISWIVFKSGTAKALSLSVIPSVIFLFDGILLGYIPLIVFAVVFGISHIFISLKNVDSL